MDIASWITDLPAAFTTTDPDAPLAAAPPAATAAPPCPRVIAATATEAKDDGFFESIGLWGTTLPKDLEVATAAFEKGDHDTARAAAEKVTDTLAEAGSVGTKRFLWALGGLLLFVLLFAELDSLRGRIVEKVRVMLGPRNAVHQEVQLRCSHGLHRHEDCQS